MRSRERAGAVLEVFCAAYRLAGVEVEVKIQVGDREAVA